jgi:hypothetical protein
MKRQNKHVGSSLEDFLTEEGILLETRAMAIKETVAWQVHQAMETEKITKVPQAALCTSGHWKTRRRTNRLSVRR